MALGSKASVGTFICSAAAIPGPEAYPPTPKTTVGPEFADEMPALEQAARQIDGGAKAGKQRDVLERPYIDEAEAESGFGDKTAFHAARRADKQNFSGMAINKFMSHGQRRNDVAAGASTGDENAQLRQGSPFRLVVASFSDTIPLVTRSSSFDLFGDVEQDADAGQREEQRRSARGDERQRNSLGGHQRQHHADVEKGLQQDRDRDAERDEARERIGGAEGHAQAADAEHHEEQ